MSLPLWFLVALANELEREDTVEAELVAMLEEKP